jgi:hypothetical protein
LLWSSLSDTSLLGSFAWGNSQWTGLILWFRGFAGCVSEDGFESRQQPEQSHLHFGCIATLGSLGKIEGRLAEEDYTIVLEDVAE